MSFLEPSLPLLKSLPFYLVIDGLTGYLCGRVGATRPELMATIFAIRAVAHTLFYLYANNTLKGKELQSQKIFLVTSSIINLTFLIVLREFDLIGRLFSCLLGLSVIGQLVHRVSYIQEHER
jgi:hypothetical protein